jgi:hypothetical protein
MTQTIAIIVNALLAVGIVTALAVVMHTPYRLHRRRALEHAVYMPGRTEQQLSRAA